MLTGVAASMHASAAPLPAQGGEAAGQGSFVSRAPERGQRPAGAVAGIDDKHWLLPQMCASCGKAHR